MPRLSRIRPGQSEAMAQLMKTKRPVSSGSCVRAFPESWVPPHMHGSSPSPEGEWYGGVAELGGGNSPALWGGFVRAAVSAASSRRRRLKRRRRANLWRAGPTPPPLTYCLCRGFSRQPRRPRPSRPTTHATRALAARRTGLGFARRLSRPRRPRRHRRRTRARHATSPSRPTSSPPGKHAAPPPCLLDRCLMFYQRGNIGCYRAILKRCRCPTGAAN
jgi:hypothetical protein